MDRGTQAVITGIIFTVLAFIFIVLRCISRLFIVKRPGIEDYLIVVAFVLSVGLTIDIELQRQNGLGKHIRDLAVEQVQATLKLLYASIVIYNFGLLVIKASILYQYLRIFVAQGYRRAAWGLMIFIWLGGVALILVACFSCSPVASFWDATLEGSCMETQPLWYTMASFQLVTDIIVLALPIPVLVKLKLPKKQKIILLFVFMLGGVGCIVSILRLHGLYAATISQDLTYDNALAVTWSTVEFNVGIMCACFPTLRPLVNAIFPKLLNSTGRGTTASNPFQASSHSRAYYQRNDSTVELSRTGVTAVNADGNSSDRISFDTATKEPGIHVKQEWSITEREDAESGTLGRAM